MKTRRSILVTFFAAAVFALVLAGAAACSKDERPPEGDGGPRHVYYLPNAPQGVAAGEISSSECEYGEKVEIKDGALFGLPENYRFAGWAVAEGGEAVYAAGEEVTLNEDLTLYARWDSAYTDRFGGSDLIFAASDKADTAVLRRGKHDFEGALSDSVFTFSLPNGDTVKGKLYADTFAYIRTDVSGEYSLLENGEVNSDIRLTVDEYWNATCTAGSSSVEGRLSRDPVVGDWSFLRGDDTYDFRFRFTEHSNTAVFEKGGNEAGEYIGLGYAGSGSDGLIGTGETILLGGYGTATLTGDGDPVDGSYTVAKTADIGGYSIYGVNALFGADTYDFYTVPLEDGMFGFLPADGYKGEYAGAGGASLELDGYGIFADSAVYTAAGRTYRGSYAFEEYRTLGEVIVLTCDSQRYYFTLDGGSFTVLEGASALPVYEFVRLQTQNGSYGIIDPLLAIYGEDSAHVLKAELYTRSQSGAYELCASGTYAEEQLDGNLYLSTFTLGRKAEGYEGDVPESFTYIVGGVSFEDRSIEVYNVIEWNGEKQYEEYTEEDGEGRIWYSPLPMGSLYYAGDGSVYQGTLSNRTEHTDFGNMKTFTFTYVDYSTTEFITLNFEMVDEAGGKFALLDNAPANLFLTDEYGATQLFASLALDGKGNAVYSADGETQVRASYTVESALTAFGDRVYSLSGAGVSFKFIIGVYYDIYTDSDYDVYYKYDPALDGLFTAEGGARVMLDGYYRALFTDGEGRDSLGTYFYTEDGEAISYFSEEDDASGERYFLISGSKLTVLGSEYGEWDLTDDNYGLLDYKTVFDGFGGVRFTHGNTAVTGTYDVIGEYDGLPELLITADFGEGARAFAVSLVRIPMGDRYCVIRNDGIAAAYVSDKWEVLYIDGYGYGMYYDAEGNAGRRVIVTLYSAERGHIGLRYSGDYATLVYVTVDRAKGSFKVNEYAERTFYAEDFSGIKFGNGAVIELLGENGTYFTDGDKAYAYFVDENNNYTSKTLFAPTASSGEYDGKTFTLWDKGMIEISGKINFLDENGGAMPGYPAHDATLSFTPDGSARMDVAAEIADGGVHYSGFRFEVVYLVFGGVRTTLVYDGAEYDVTFSAAGGVRTFSAAGGRSVTTFNDLENTGNSNGSFTVTAFGFGPIGREDPQVHGVLNYKGSSAYTFDFTVGEENITVCGYDEEYGDIYALRFNSGDTDYVMTYFISGIGYYLRSLSAYTEYTAAGGSHEYKVGVCRFIFSNGTFNDRLLSAVSGEVCELILFEDGEVLPAKQIGKKSGTTSTYGYICSDGGEDGRQFWIELTDGGVAVTEYAV